MEEEEPPPPGEETVLIPIKKKSRRNLRVRAVDDTNEANDAEELS